jgi:putative ABC transport system permease protein
MFDGQISTQAGGERAGRKIRMERTDVDAIRDAVPLAVAVSPEVMAHPWRSGNGRRNCQ